MPDSELGEMSLKRMPDLIWPDLAGLIRMPGWVEIGGQVVEMRSFNQAYLGAWFRVQVIGLKTMDGCNYAYLEHQDFQVTDDDGSDPHREWAKIINLRPHILVKRKLKWNVGECVETLWGGAWWVGYIKEVLPSRKYIVWYNNKVETQIITLENIRVALKFEHATIDNPEACWKNQRSLQKPLWTTRLQRDETQGQMSKPIPKAQQRRAYDPASDVEKSEDDEWRPGAKRPRVQNQPSKSRRAPKKSQVPPTKKIIVRHPKTMALVPRLAIVQGLPAVNRLDKPSEQATVCITPGWSPPLSDSPDQDSANLLGTTPFVNLAASPSPSPSPFNSGRCASDTDTRSSNSGNDGEEDDDDDDVGHRRGDGGQGLMSNQIVHHGASFGEDGEEDDDDDDVGHRRGDGGKGLMSNQIVHHSAFEIKRKKCIQAYRMLLSCFRSCPEGGLDKHRNNILRLVREEFGLTMKTCEPIHCEFFNSQSP